MLSILPWALVALPLTEARFGIRPRAQNNETVQCCPCVSSVLNPQATTVTVTVTGPKETVTVDHTIVQQATTLFVTHTVAPGLPSAVTPEVTVHPDLPAKVETVFNAVSIPEPSTSTEKQPIKTVTVTAKPDEPKSVDAPSVITVTFTPGNSVSTQSTPSPDATEPSSSSSGQEIAASTVTVTIGTQTKASQSTESKPSIKTMTFGPTPPSAETVTFVENPASPTTAATGTPADKPANSTSETVTSKESPVSPSTPTVTLSHSPSKPVAETVTFVDNSALPTSVAAATTTSGANLANSTVESATFAENLPQPSSSSASTKSSPNSSIQTVNFVSNTPNPTITPSSPTQPVITTPPQLETGSPVTGRFTTLTQTMTSGGNISVEITIVNIFTGESICKKEGSDEPCDSSHETHQLEPSEKVPCLTTGIFTKTATAFNTVVVTVSPGLWSNGTLATGVAPPAGAATGTGSPILRRGRVPMVRRRL